MGKHSLVKRRPRPGPAASDVVLLQHLAAAAVALGATRTAAARACGAACYADLERGQVPANVTVIARAQALLRAQAERWADQMRQLTTMNLVSEDHDRAATCVRGALLDIVGGVAHTWMRDVKLQLAYALEAGMVDPSRERAVADFIRGPGLARGTEPRTDPAMVAALRRAHEEISEQDRKTD